MSKLIKHREEVLKNFLKKQNNKVIKTSIEKYIKKYLLILQIKKKIY